LEGVQGSLRKRKALGPSRRGGELSEKNLEIFEGGKGELFYQRLVCVEGGGGINRGVPTYVWTEGGGRQRLERGIVYFQPPLKNEGEIAAKAGKGLGLENGTREKKSPVAKGRGFTGNGGEIFINHNTKLSGKRDWVKFIRGKVITYRRRESSSGETGRRLGGKQGKAQAVYPKSLRGGFCTMVTRGTGVRTMPHLQREKGKTGMRKGVFPQKKWEVEEEGFHAKKKKGGPSSMSRREGVDGS